MSLNTLVSFTKFSIKNLVLKNRYVRSAAYEAMGSKTGEATDKLKKYLGKLAKNDVGLIFIGSTYVNKGGRAHDFQVGLTNETQMDAVRKVADEVRKYGSACMIQINHAGVNTKEKYTYGNIPEGPSQVSKYNKEMSLDTIMDVIESFIISAKLAYQAGLDGVELHGAHGYLLSQFLSPLYNKRTDRFGGDLKGRFEIIKLIGEGIRSAVPSSFPVLLKINGSDFEPGGITPDESVEFCKMAEKVGFDAIEVSGGSGRKPYSIMADHDFEYLFKDPKKREAMEKRLSDIHFYPLFNLEFAEKIKKAVKIPVLCVGGFRSLKEVEDAIKSNKCDLVSLARPLIKEPDLVKKFFNGTSTKSTCFNCNRCFFHTAVNDNPLKCLKY